MPQTPTKSTAKPATDSLLRYRFAAININTGLIIPSSIIPPNTTRRHRIEDPTADERRNIAVPDPLHNNDITDANLDTLLDFEMPPNEGQADDKQAIDMIEVRRLKMKKHKLRKWKKKFKYPEAKRRLRLRKRKEKELQAELLAKMREAETFSAEKYVEEKLAAASAPVPRKRKLIKVF